MTTSRPSYYSSFIFASSIVLISLCVRIVTSSTQPSNVALLDGDSTTLQCSLGATAPFIQWLFVVTGSSTTITLTNYTNNICSTNVPQYQVNVNAAQGQCDLIINNVTPSEAGWYQCQVAGSGGFTANAQVTVLYSRPNGSLNATNVVVNDVVSMNCAVNYSSAGVNVSMTWSGCSPQTLQTRFYVNGIITSAVSEISIVAQHQDYLQTCSCNTTTVNALPTPPLILASGIVSTSYNPYSSVWTSPSNIQVQYCPYDVTLSSPSTSFLPLNATIECTATGNPQPTHYYLVVIEPGNNETKSVNGSSVVLSYEGEYRIVCYATNFITSSHGNYPCTNQSQTYVYNVSSSAVEFTTVPPSTRLDVQLTKEGTTGVGFSNDGVGTGETVPLTTTAAQPNSTNDTITTQSLPYECWEFYCLWYFWVPTISIGIILAIILIVCFTNKRCPLFRRFRRNRDKSPRQSLKESQNGRGSSNPEFQMKPTSPSDPALHSQYSREDSHPYPQQERQMGAAYDNHAVDPAAVVYAELQQPQPQVDNRAGSRQPVKFQADNTGEYSQVRYA